VINAGHCHCESCRRATSSPITTFFVVRRSDVAFTGETFRHYPSSPGVSRGFCGRCGSPMSYETERRPDQIDLYMASLDAGQSVPIREHWHWEEHLVWLNVVDDLPRHEG
jgi:hypothetical protein